MTASNASAKGKNGNDVNIAGQNSGDFKVSSGGGNDLNSAVRTGGSVQVASGGGDDNNVASMAGPYKVASGEEMIIMLDSFLMVMSRLPAVEEMM